MLNPQFPGEEGKELNAHWSPKRRRTLYTRMLDGLLES